MPATTRSLHTVKVGDDKTITATLSIDVTTATAVTLRLTKADGSGGEFTVAGSGTGTAVTATLTETHTTAARAGLWLESWEITFPSGNSPQSAPEPQDRHMLRIYAATEA